MAYHVCRIGLLDLALLKMIAPWIRFGYSQQKRAVAAASDDVPHVM